MCYHQSKFVVVFIHILLLSSARLAQASVVYVDADALGRNTGTSWKDAFTDLQDAILAASIGDEVWVAEGIYKPGPPGSDRTVNFQLSSGVQIYGGFAGTEVSREQRDPISNTSVLSGDLNGDDGPDFQNNVENTYHVVNASNTDNTSVLDGFTISSGNADGPFMPDCQNCGAAIYLANGYALIAQCSIINNSAHSGAVYCENGSPTFTQCTIRDNAAGGLEARTGGQPIVGKCAFIDNEFSGIFSDTDGLIIDDCLFLSNGSFNLGTGGGISIYGKVMIRRSVFVGNQAGKSGGGLHVASEGAHIDNSIFINNSAALGDNILNGGDLTIVNCVIGFSSAGVFSRGIASGIGVLTIQNSILWGNGDGSEGSQLGPLEDGEQGTVVIDYSSVEGWTGMFGGVGNNGLYPLFVDADGLDDIPGTEDDDLRLLPGSPAIDSGDSTAVPADALDLDEDGDVLEPIPFDLDGLPRFVDDPKTPDEGIPWCDGDICLPVVDRGAYEFQTACAGDANGDKLVDPLDSGFILARLNCPVGQGDPFCDAADANLDGIVDPLDVGYVLSRFGECP